MKVRINILIALIFVLSFLGFLKDVKTFPALLDSLDTLQKYKEISRIWITDQAGEFALDDKAQSAIRLLRKFDAPNYHFDKNTDIDWTHLMVGAWPVQYKKDSQFYIFLDGQKETCSIIDKIKGVKLGRCS